MLMREATFRTDSRTGLAADAIVRILDAHHHAVVVVIFEVAVIVVEILRFEHLFFLDQIEDIARTHFEAASAADAGTLIQLADIGRRPNCPAESHTGYQFSHDVTYAVSAWATSNFRLASSQALQAS